MSEPALTPELFLESLCPFSLRGQFAMKCENLSYVQCVKSIFCLIGE